MKEVLTISFFFVPFCVFVTISRCGLLIAGQIRVKVQRIPVRAVQAENVEGVVTHLQVE